MHGQIICDAISRRRLLSFRYKDHVTPTVVEPYLYGINQADHHALRAWLREGATHSVNGPRWRMYLPEEMRDIQVLDERFDTNRPGYHAIDNGFAHILCRVSPPV